MNTACELILLQARARVAASFEPTCQNQQVVGDLMVWFRAYLRIEGCYLKFTS